MPRDLCTSVTCGDKSLELRVTDFDQSELRGDEKPLRHQEWHGCQFEDCEPKLAADHPYHPHSLPSALSPTLDHLAVPVDLSFGLQPVFEVVAGLAAARLIKFIGALFDLILIGMVFSR